MVDMSSSVDSDSDSESSECDVEQPFQDDSLRSLCLFCSQCSDSPQSTFEHMANAHGADIISLCVQNKFDCFSFIKFINYIRNVKTSSAELGIVIANRNWDSDTFMKPVLQDDALLTFDIEAFTEDDNDKNVEKPKPLQDDLRLEELKSMIEETVANGVNGSGCVDLRIATEENASYFMSYSHFAIHHEMLSDKIRTNAYRDSILGNKQLFSNADVLDIGCGTGILSLFAATNNAKSVLAVDKSDIIYNAMDIAQENDLLHKIKFIRSTLEEIDFDQKFDVIVSEWMGYFLIFEGMLDTVLYARDRLLKPNGVLLPNRCVLMIAAVSDLVNFRKYVSFWDDVYGFKMSSMKKGYFSEVSVDIVSPDDICTESAVIKELNLMNCTLSDSQFIQNQFQLKSAKSCVITAITIWFDCFFDDSRLETKVKLSTSPYTEATHWKQCVLPLRKPFGVSENDLIVGSINVKRSKSDPRGLNVELIINDQKCQRYVMQ